MSDRIDDWSDAFRRGLVAGLRGDADFVGELMALVRQHPGGVGMEDLPEELRSRLLNYLEHGVREVPGVGATIGPTAVLHPPSIATSEAFGTPTLAATGLARVHRPPGHLLVRLADSGLFSRKTCERVLLPIIADLRHEYFSVLAEGRSQKARLIVVRGWLSLASTLVRLALNKLLDVLVQLHRVLGP